MDESFDKACLCIGSLDTDPSQCDKVLVGSHSGILRVHQPTCTQLEDGTFGGFRPENVLLEYQMAHPILQVALGYFVSGSNRIYIAILHPRKLSVLSFTGDASDVEHGSRYALNIVYEHTLQHSAFCLVTGPFGGAKGRDLLCIQSLNGALSFFEQESFAFTRFLPEFLLPGPIAYVPKTDSFVTVSTSFELESYRFQVLAVAGDNADPFQDGTVQKGKPVIADWSFSLGEQPLDIAMVELPNAPGSLLVFGERTLFAFKPSGVLQFCMRMDYTQACMFPYSNDNGGTLNILVATQASTLLIYQDTTLKWAAHLDFTPVAIAKATIANIPGIVVVLSEDGKLSCCYLGTEPSLFAAPVPERGAFVFKDAEQELRELRKVIKLSTNNTTSKGSDLRIRVQTSISSEQSSAECDNHGHDFCLPTALLKIHLQASTPINNLYISIHATRPLSASPSRFTLNSLSDHHQEVLAVQQSGEALPSSLEVGIVAIFQNNNGATRTVQTSPCLPLNVVVRACSVDKALDHKITIETNKQMVALSDLFPEYLSDPGSQDIGMEFLDGSQVVVLASRSSQKYRLQSTCLAALWLPTWELIRRLNRYYKRASPQDDTFKCSCNSTLPFQEYFDVIDKHYETRLKIKELEELLGHRAAQFRVVQKCVLTKLKDKTPTPLNNLDSLLDVTQRELLSLANMARDMHKEHENIVSALSCATHLMLLLLRLKAPLSAEEYKLLQAAFAVDIEPDTSEGWEEKTEASIIHLLNTCLRKQEEAMHPLPSELTTPTDLSKLKRLIVLLFDRLLGGERLCPNEAQKICEANSVKDGRYTQNGGEQEDEEPFELSASSLVSPTQGACISGVPKNEELQNWVPDPQDPIELENNHQV